LENDNYILRTKIQSILATIKSRDEELARLDKTLKRENFNSEISGTSVVEVPKDQVSDSSEQTESITLDRKIEEMRDRLIAINEDIELAKRQKLAAEDQVRDLRKELDEQDILCTRVMASKAEVERRLGKRVDQIEEQIARKKRQGEADYKVVYNRLEATLQDKREEVKVPEREKAELESSIARGKQYTSKQAGRLTDRLDLDTHRFLNIDKDKREHLQEGRFATREAGEFLNKVANLEKEVKRYQHQIELAKKEQDKLQDNNQRLEAALKRTDTGR